MPAKAKAVAGAVGTRESVATSHIHSKVYFLLPNFKFE
jgi:hypothetical protein